MRKKALASVMSIGVIGAPAAIALAAESADAPTGDDSPARLSAEGTHQLRDARVVMKHDTARQRRIERQRRVRKHRARKAQRTGTPAAPANTAGGSAASPQLEAIAACESGGNPRAIGGGGAFRGKYQFDRGTWASVGGSGDPAAAPEAEQDRRAAMLLARSGSSPWPVCGQ